MSEREDEDIYAHYMNKMNEQKAKAEEENELLDKTEKFVSNQAKKFEDEMFPEIPNFKGFF